MCWVHEGYVWERMCRSEERGDLQGGCICGVGRG